MPSWQPNMNNPRWNHAAANQAVAALQRAADELEGTAIAREHAAREATAQWHGAHRRVFDIHLETALRRARELSTAYREAATRIMQASERARNEQAQREHGRQRWQQELADEQRRERERQGAMRNSPPRY